MDEDNYFGPEKIFDFFSGWWDKVADILKDLPETMFIGRIKWILIFAAVILGSFCAFLVVMIIGLKKRAKISYRDFFSPEEISETRIAKWKGIKKMADSENPSDWKMAIIHTDELIDEMMKRIGYEGDTLGDKMKAIDPIMFQNLQPLWEAHKVRNRIVHEGELFAISQEEAKETLGKYEKALKELRYI